MSEHRHPRENVSKDVLPDKPPVLEAGPALQRLCGQIYELEVVANAANEAVVQLPFPEGREERRPFDRVSVLTTTLANELTGLASYVDDLAGAGVVTLPELAAPRGSAGMKG
jgi:hypothetical protein